MNTQLNIELFHYYSFFLLILNLYRCCLLAIQHITRALLNIFNKLITSVLEIITEKKKKKHIFHCPPEYTH